jgi:hypothetical protein
MVGSRLSAPMFPGAMELLKKYQERGPAAIVHAGVGLYRHILDLRSNAPMCCSRCAVDE